MISSIAQKRPFASIVTEDEETTTNQHPSENEREKKSL